MPLAAAVSSFSSTFDDDDEVECCLCIDLVLFESIGSKQFFSPIISMSMSSVLFFMSFISSALICVELRLLLNSERL